jgi:hypothetical protein
MKVTIKPRTGKDFFEYTERSLANPKLTEIWAIEEFVLVDGNPLTIEEIAKLKAGIYLKLASSIFSTNINPASETPDEIEVEGYKIKCKKISRNFLTELQAYTKNSGNNVIKIMKFCIDKFYDIEFTELEKMPYQVAVYMFNKINFFLSELSTDTDEFYIDELFDSDS